MKKFTWLVVLFCLGLFSLFAQANSMARTALSQFENQYPQYRGIAVLTGGNGERTWQQQMEFILSRPGSYENIQRRFTQRFGVQLPAPSSQMTNEMLQWWEREIMAQAGRPDGFAHVGGRAQDIYVGNLDIQGKEYLQSFLTRNGLRVLREIPPNYDGRPNPISMAAATVFHCYIP